MSKHTDFSRIFIDRPILATVMSTLILVSGLMAIPNLPISEYPDVVPPSVQVTAIYPGANPRTIADTVAGPLEEAVNGVENMIYMKSTASSDGQMALTVTFKGGTDVDLAAVQVQNRVAQAIPRLPEAVRALGVTTVKASPTLTMVVHLDSPNKTYDSLYLSNFANLRVRDELARLPGVGQAIAFGIGNYAMRIWIDPARAAARGLSAGDIVNAIREQNIEVSAGSIGSPPTPKGSVLQISVNAQGRLASPEAFGEVVLKADGAELTRQLCHPLAAQQRGRGRHRDLRGARRQHDCAVRCDPQPHGRSRARVPGGRPLVRGLRPDGVRQGLDPLGHRDAA
jgi:multidrug efflux pump